MSKHPELGLVIDEDGTICSTTFGSTSLVQIKFTLILREISARGVGLSHESELTSC